MDIDQCSPLQLNVNLRSKQLRKSDEHFDRINIIKVTFLLPPVSLDLLQERDWSGWRSWDNNSQPSNTSIHIQPNSQPSQQQTHSSSFLVTMAIVLRLWFLGTNIWSFAILPQLWSNPATAWHIKMCRIPKLIYTTSSARKKSFTVKTIPVLDRGYYSKQVWPLLNKSLNN